ncbi:proline--tRNA ligase [Candidatus Dependentiae bacterium]|nr:proline--tRNA ligase [Candidatus Dependentiae bacterium]
MKKLTDIKTDFPGWYQDIIFQAELVDSSPTRGSMVIRPYGYAIWENIQKILDKKIKVLGAQNAYFPLLIPESFLKKEAEHVEGFAPEVAVVTHAGGKKLEEPFVIRPTSETIIYSMFSRWIHSWRDLPLKINQWANVVRWEMRPRAFLRTTEFLWQEGHTVHASREEAMQMALDAREMYKDFVENYLAIPVFSGIKSESERFAGADETYCIEAIMPDGKGLQMGTTHLLAHSFPESFEISFQDKDGTMKVPYCSSWGVSTRMIGGLIMSHGDENGLILPPKIAPVQAIIIPIYRNEDDKKTVLEMAEKLEDLFEKLSIRIAIDNDETKTPGAKFFHWELRGVPIRIEIGPKDVAKNQVVLVSRVEKDKAKKKSFVSIDQLEKALPDMLDTIQRKLLETAKVRSEKLLEKNGWCGSAACEATLKEDKRTIRCLIESKEHTNCFSCNKPSIADVIIAKAY